MASSLQFKSYKLSTLLLYLCILIFIIGFNFTDSPPPPFGWYQQFMPNLGGRQINDIFFLDSLTGWAITNSLGQYDTAFVLRTTNGGDNWIISYARSQQYTGFYRIYFLNSSTGFICGVSQYNGLKGLSKTNDGGFNWFDINVPDPTLTYLDMNVLNEESIWLVSNNNPAGGVFRTTNGGISWDRQFSGGTQNPNHVYMFDSQIGFITNHSALPNIYRTTNSGLNWNVFVSGEYFVEMYFIDNLTGWRTAGDTMKFTSDGGFNWSRQVLPYGGMIESNVMTKFSVLNRDTLWGSGGYVHYPNNQLRGIIYRTTNGGINWLFQIPDTSMPIVAQYEFINFVNKNYGWCYANFPTYVSGIHTTTGGDSEWYTGIKQISSSVPKTFRLYQNYPNPFNPRTVINYELRITSYVRLIVYDITGREVQRLVDQKQSAGEYEVDFMGKFVSSGVYLYRMQVTDEKGNKTFSDTKKMILLK